MHHSFARPLSSRSSRTSLLLTLCLALAFHASAQPGPVRPTPPRILLGTPEARAQVARPHAHTTPAGSSLPQVAKPQFSVAPGSYSGAQTISVTDSTPGATIYIGRNGEYPNTYLDTDKYTGPITVSSSEVIFAFATASGYADSDYVSGTYYITSVPSRFLYNIAGTDTFGFTGIGGPATSAALLYPHTAVADASGNVYISEHGDNVVLKIDANTGIITTIAGTGEQGDKGDGGLATSATLWWPSFLALDGAGNLYIAEDGDYVVRKLNLATGIITRFAGDPDGTGTKGTGLGTSFASEIIGLVAGSQGNVFIGTGYSIVKVDSTGKASEYAGYNTTPDFQYLNAFTMDTQGNIYGWESGYGAIDKITPAEQVTIYAGSRNGIFIPGGGDGGPATKALLGLYGFLATDSHGNLYISDSTNEAIREVDAATGIINTIAGHFQRIPYGGSGDPATSAGIIYPQNLTVDASGNVYLANGSAATVHKITAPGTPPTQPTPAPVFSVASGTFPDAKTLNITSNTPGAAIFVTFDGYDPITFMQGYHGPINVTGSANLKAIAVAPGFLKSTISSAAYTITAPPNHVISAFAGTGRAGFSGAGGPATSAQLAYPTAAAFDSNGNTYIADQGNNVVWKVDSSGIITVAAGNGQMNDQGDGGPATSASLYQPSALACDKAGNLYIAENNRVRVVSASTGIITNYAGGTRQSTPGQGDGGPAASAYLALPGALAFNSGGNLIIADTFDDRIREVDAKTMIISSIAGVEHPGPDPGDGGPATAASMSPRAMVLDQKGNIYIVDERYSRVRKIDSATGIITTIAGGGNNLGPANDGLNATDIRILIPYGVAVDATGNVFYSEISRVREVDAATGKVSTIAGNTYYGYSGDGGEATIATLSVPQQISFDSKGDLYIPDISGQVRKVTFPAPAATPALSVAGGAYTSAQHVTLTDSTSGATIYYTLDGTTPDTGSTTYTGPITIRESATLQAVAAANGHAISAIAKAVYTITLQTPTIALSSSAATAYAANPVTFTATLTAAAGSPTGTVTFMDGTTELGTGTVSGGSATYTTSSLAVGTHTITAVYSGDDGFNPTTSADATVTITDFNFAPPSGGTTSATVQPGGTATYQLTVTPPSGSTTLSAVTFTVAGLPAGATATFNPSSVPANSGTTNVTLSVKVPAQSAAVPAAAPRFPLVLGLALLPLLGLGKARRASKTLLIVLAIGSAAALTVFTGCGGGGSGGSNPPPPQSQTYNLTVTATAGFDSHTTKLTLTVQ